MITLTYISVIGYKSLQHESRKKVNKGVRGSTVRVRSSVIPETPVDVEIRRHVGVQLERGKPTVRVVETQAVV